MSHNDKITRAEVYRLADTSAAAVSLGYCAAQTLLGRLERYGYNSGVYGWRYDVFFLYGVTIITGYATIGAYTSDAANRITKRYEHLAIMLNSCERYNKAARRFTDYRQRATNEERLYTYIRQRWTRELIRACASSH